jgi:integrase
MTELNLLTEHNLDEPELDEPELDEPGLDTPVLLHRKLNPAADTSMLSVFAEDRWNLTPGLFEAHAPTTRLNFEVVPPQFRDQIKHYIWHVLNHPTPQRLRQAQGTRLALRSVAIALPRLNTFLVWLDSHAVTSLTAVTAQHLDRYLHDVVITETTENMKSGLLVEVRRLWSYRDSLPESMRLPASPPWDGEEPRDLLGVRVKSGVNRTPRLHTDTIDLLLLWSLRFIDDFATDIITAFHEHLVLWPRTPSVRDPQIRVTRRSIDDVLPEVITYLEHLRATGAALPGRRRPDGMLEVDWPHLTRIFNAGESAFTRSSRLRDPIEQCHLPIAEAAYLSTPITGQIDQHPWRSAPIAYEEAPALAGLLRTACFIVIAYLSGARTGEILNLERGCVCHDPVTDLWLISGRKFKGAQDTNGDKIPEGQQREDPWVIVEQAAHAVDVLERLHRDQLLFPDQLHPFRIQGGRSSTRIGHARKAASLVRDITDLTGWANARAQALARPHELIPPDPDGPIAPSRFRRTLAWHIVRKPRGLIAGAIQYGHLHVQMTLGYSGAYDSGFPDEQAFEEWLFRLERISEDHQRLLDGEHVSGPAADPYQHRVHAAHQQFAGRVLPNTQQARDMIANPLLQIYPGRAMTCVFDQTKALCQTRATENDVRRTPDQDDCRPNCQNIAYTDRDISELREQAAELKQMLSDYLAPSPRHHRIRAEHDRLRALIHQHTAETTHR